MLPAISIFPQFETAGLRHSVSQLSKWYQCLLDEAKTVDISLSVRKKRFEPIAKFEKTKWMCWKYFNFAKYLEKIKLLQKALTSKG